MHTSPSQLLDRQLDLLDQQSDPEKWKHDHEAAMLCRDIEDMIALALETLDRIRKRSELAYFRRWHAIGLRALQCIEWVEGEGFEPERSSEFRFAVNEASMANDAERIGAAMGRLEAGQGRPLDEILDALPPQA